MTYTGLEKKLTYSFAKLAKECKINFPKIKGLSVYEMASTLKCEQVKTTPQGNKLPKAIITSLKKF